MNNFCLQFVNDFFELMLCKINVFRFLYHREVFKVSTEFNFGWECTCKDFLR